MKRTEYVNHVRGDIQSGGCFGREVEWIIVAIVWSWHVVAINIE